MQRNAPCILESGVQLIFPHTDTDWRDMLEEVVPCFVEIASHIAKRKKLLIVCPDAAATYANFLVINEAGLVPFYNSPKDEIARTQLQKAFPDREIVGINCLPLIKQHGSLHCVTMLFPEGVLG